MAGRRSRRPAFVCGYSNVPGGIVADVSPLNAVELEPERPIARIGGGANVLDVYRELVLRHDRALPVGTGPTVGIAGLTLGGGFGRLMRRYGVTSDSLRGATVVLADGSAVRCSEDQRTDLFWALRGGGAGTAIVNSCVSRSARRRRRRSRSRSPTPGRRRWRRSTPGQRTLPSAPEMLAYGRLRALRRPDGALTLTVSGHWYDTEAKLRALLAPLVAAAPARPPLRRRTFAQAALPDSVQLRAEGPMIVDPPRFANYQRSDFFSGLSVAGGDRRARRADRALARRRRQRPRGRRAARCPRRRRQPPEAERDGVRSPPSATALRVPELLGRRRSTRDGRRLRAVDARHPRRDGALAFGAAFQNHIDPELVI